MNKINYKESIDLINEIKELLIINIDENFTTIDEDDFINIKGEIRISGEVKLEEEKKSFLHPVNVDISLSKQQLTNDNVKISIDDFTYNINNNIINIDLFLKIEGLKEMEESFPAKDDRETIQIEEVIDDENLNNDSTSINDIFDDSSESNHSDSLLSQIFKNRSVKKESISLIHVVKNETTYEEIASLYNLNPQIIENANKGKEIKNGKLIFIPR